jgi:hypothetical protein
MRMGSEQAAVEISASDEILIDTAECVAYNGAESAFVREI